MLKKSVPMGWEPRLLTPHTIFLCFQNKLPEITFISECTFSFLCSAVQIIDEKIKINLLSYVQSSSGGHVLICNWGTVQGTISRQKPDKSLFSKSLKVFQLWNLKRRQEVLLILLILASGVDDQGLTIKTPAPMGKLARKQPSLFWNASDARNTPKIFKPS